MRRPLAKVAYEAFLAVGFRAQLQDLLLPHEVEGESGRHYERQIFWGFGFDIFRIVVKNESVADLVKPGEFRSHARIDTSVAVVQEVDIAFEEGILRVGIGVDQFRYAKRRTADGDDVHTPVIVPLQHFRHLSGATYADDSLGQAQQNSELGFFVDATAHHVTVARLEDVQREGGAGKKNDVQREKRNTVRPHESHS